MMTYKEIEIPLANGFTVIIDNADDEAYVSLKNPNNYIVSDAQLTEEQKKAIKEIVSRRVYSMFSEGDRVKIIDSMDSGWIGKKATITRVFHHSNEPIFYQLNIGGGDWLGSCLKKI